MGGSVRGIPTYRVDCFYDNFLAISYSQRRKASPVELVAIFIRTEAAPQIVAAPGAQ